MESSSFCFKLSSFLSKSPIKWERSSLAASLRVSSSRTPTRSPTSDYMGNTQDCNAATESENVDGTATNSSVSTTTSPDNIIMNHDFSDGLKSWKANCCEGFVVSVDANSAESGGCYAVVTNRRASWQGLEQDITSRVSIGSTYSVSARVGVAGTLQGPVEVLATLKLVYPVSDTMYLRIGKISVSKERWEMLEGKFSVSPMPKRVVFFLEGAPPGVVLLVKSVTMSCSSDPSGCREEICKLKEEHHKVLREMKERIANLEEKLRSQEEEARKLKGLLEKSEEDRFELGKRLSAVTTMCNYYRGCLHE